MAVGDQIYSGVVGYSRIKSQITFYILIVIAISLCISGVFTLFSKNKEDTKKSDKWKTGGTFIAVAIVLVIFGYISNYLTQTSDTFAALNGASDIAKIF
jgi:uncharacterized membrane protein HdeD (DUF308 family)